MGGRVWWLGALWLALSFGLGGCVLDFAETPPLVRQAEGQVEVRAEAAAAAVASTATSCLVVLWHRGEDREVASLTVSECGVAGEAPAGDGAGDAGEEDPTGDWTLRVPFDDAPPGDYRLTFEALGPDPDSRTLLRAVREPLTLAPGASNTPLVVVVDAEIVDADEDGFSDLEELQASSDADDPESLPPDETPPTLVADVTVQPEGVTDLRVRWSASGQDRHTPTSDLVYDVFVARELGEAAAAARGDDEAAAFSEPGARSALIEGLEPGAAYVVSVCARDEAGLRSAPLAEVTTRTHEAKGNVRVDLSGLTPASTLRPEGLRAAVVAASVQVAPDAVGAQPFAAGPLEISADGVLSVPFEGLHDGPGAVRVTLLGAAPEGEDAPELARAGVEATLLREVPTDVTVLAEDFPRPDGDGDGFMDWEEALAGSDPLAEGSVPEPDQEPPVFDGPLAAQASSDMEILLQWPPASDRHSAAAELRYAVYLQADQAPEPEQGAEPLDTVVGVTSYLVRDVDPGVTYHAAVQALDGAGQATLLRAAPVTTQSASGELLIDLTGLPPALRAATRAATGSLSFYRMADRPHEQRVEVPAGQEPPEQLVVPFEAAALGLARATLALLGEGDLVLAHAVVEANLANGPGNQIRLGAEAFVLPDADMDGFFTWEEVSGGSDPEDADSLPLPDGEAPTFAGPLLARATSDLEVLLQWPSASDRHTPPADLQYAIYLTPNRPPDVDGEDAPLQVVTGVTSYVAGGLAPGGNYHGAVVVRDAAGQQALLGADPVLTEAAAGEFLVDLRGLPESLNSARRSVRATLTFFRAPSLQRTVIAQRLPGDDGPLTEVVPFGNAALGLARVTVEVEDPDRVVLATATVEANLVNGPGNQIRVETADFELPDMDEDGFANWEEVVAGSDSTDPGDLPRPDEQAPAFDGLQSLEVIDDRGLRLAWGEATDRHHRQDDGLTFSIYLDTADRALSLDAPGVPAPAGQRTYTATGLEPGVLYHAAVVVRDAAGNRAGQEAVLQARTWEATGSVRLDLGPAAAECAGWADWQDPAGQRYPCAAETFEVSLTPAGGGDPVLVLSSPVQAGAAEVPLQGLPIELFQLSARLLSGLPPGALALASSERSVLLERETSILLDASHFTALDDDGDGFANHEELRAGSDPNDAGPAPAESRPADVVAPDFGGAAVAVPGGAGRIQLAWDPATDRHDASRSLVYVVYLADDELGGNLSELALSRAGATDTDVEDLAAATRYCFVVRARDSAGNEDENLVTRCALTERADAAPEFGADVVSQLQLGEGEWLVQRVAVADPDGDPIDLAATLLPARAALLPLCGAEVSCDDGCVDTCLQQADSDVGESCRAPCGQRARVGDGGCQDECLTEFRTALQTCLAAECTPPVAPGDAAGQAEAALVFWPDYEQGGRSAGDTRVYLAELQADAGVATTRHLIQLTVAHTDRAPVAQAEWDVEQVLEFAAGGVLVAQVEFSDPDGEPIELRCGPLPDWGRYETDESEAGTVKARLVLAPGFNDVGRRVITFHPLRAGRSLPEAKVSLKIQVKPAVGPLDYDLRNEDAIDRWGGVLDDLHGVLVADLDGDGMDDVALTAFNELDLYLGGPGRWAAEEPNFRFWAGPQGFTAGALDASDLTGDGVAELVVGSYSEDEERGVATIFDGRAMEHSANGSRWALAGAREVDLPCRSDSLLLAALDGDGALDLVVRDEETGEVAVLRGLVDEAGRAVGSFGPAEMLAAGAAGNETDLGETLAAGDMDGDGLSDLAVLNTTESAVYLFRGRAGQTPEPAGRVPVGGKAGAIVVADLTGLGRADLVVGAGTLLLHWDAPAEGPLTAEALSAPRITTLGLGVGQHKYVAGVAALDMFGTGSRDLLVAAADGSSVLLPGPRTYPAQSAERQPTLHFPGLPDDIDRTSDDEIDFWPGSLLRVGDLTGDGTADVVLAGLHARLGRRSHRRVARLLDDDRDRIGGEGWSYSRPVELDEGLIVDIAGQLGDLNGDQVPDLIVHAEAGVAIRAAFTAAECPGRGIGFYGDPHIVDLTRRGGSRGDTTAALDIDGDGRRELLVLHDGGLAVVSVQGDAWSELTSSYVNTELPWVADAVLPADVTGEGKAQVVLLSPSSAVVSVWQATVERGRPDGGFEPLSETRMLGVPLHATVGDFDRDGFDDVLVTLQGLQSAVTLRGGPSGELSLGHQQALPRDARWVATALVDEDWRRDVFFVHEVDWVNDDDEDRSCNDGSCDAMAALGAGESLLGDGTFAATLSLGDATWQRPVVADMDNDGLEEVLTTSDERPWLRRLAMGPDGPVLEAQQGSDEMFPAPSVDALDVNADGIPDPIVCASGSCVQYGTPTVPVNGVWEGAIPLSLPAGHRQDAQGAPDTRAISCAPADSGELYFRFETQSAGTLMLELDAFYPGAALALIADATGRELACVGGEAREETWRLVADGLPAGAYHLAVSGVPAEGDSAFRLRVNPLSNECADWCLHWCSVAEGWCRSGDQPDILTCRERCLAGGQAWLAPPAWCAEQVDAVWERPCREFFSGQACLDAVCDPGYACLGEQGCVPLCGAPPNWACPNGLRCFQLAYRGQPVEETGVCLP